MDLSDFSKACEDGATLELKTPTGQPITKPDGSPVTIKYAGTESAKYRKARNVVANKYIKTARGGGAMAAKTAEESIDDDAFILASVTLAWDGILDKGQALDCNFSNAKKIYLEYDWLREQATEFIRERQNFWSASSQS